MAKDRVEITAFRLRRTIALRQTRCGELEWVEDPGTCEVETIVTDDLSSPAVRLLLQILRESEGLSICSAKQKEITRIGLYAKINKRLRRIGLAVIHLRRKFGRLGT